MLSTFRQAETVLMVYNGRQPLPIQFNEEWAEVLSLWLKKPTWMAIIWALYTLCRNCHSTWLQNRHV